MSVVYNEAAAEYMLILESQSSTPDAVSFLPTIDWDEEVADVTICYNSSVEAIVNDVDTLMLGAMKKKFCYFQFHFLDVSGQTPESVSGLPAVASKLFEFVIYQRESPAIGHLPFAIGTPHPEKNPEVNISLYDDSLHVEGYILAYCCGYHYVTYIIDEEAQSVSLNLLQSGECNCVNTYPIRFSLPYQGDSCTVTSMFAGNSQVTTAVVEAKQKDIVSKTSRFDLSGKGTSSLQGGIYIQNGKKVLKR